MSLHDPEFGSHVCDNPVAVSDQSNWDRQLFSNKPSSARTLEDLIGIYNHGRRPSDPEILDCTWQNVVDKMTEARKSYEERGQRNAVRGFFRRGKSIQMVFNPFLEVIPEDHGLKALKGGLTLLFNCLAGREANVERIFRCFEDVPLLMGDAQEILDIFHQNLKLRDHVWGLYHSLITGVPDLIKILLGKSDSKWWARFCQKIPSEQERLITDILSTVDNAKRKLANYAMTVGYQSITHIDQITSKTAGQVSSIQINVRELSRDIRMQFGELMQALHGINKALLELREESAQQRKQIADMVQPNQCIHVMHTVVYQVGQETFPHRALSAPSLPQRTAPNRYSARYRSSCISALCGQGIEPRNCLHATADVQQLLKKKYEFDEESIGRSRWLMSSGHFREWLILPGSGALAVHSYMDFQPEGKTSAMSLFSATLASALMQQGEHVIVLSFFCGLQANSENRFFGPLGILRSLALQLLFMLDGLDVDEAPTHFARMMEDLGAGRPQALSYVLRQGIAQLPPETTVFCLVDAADMYDTQRHGWRNDVREVFRHLGSVSTEPYCKASFKLFVTTPPRTDTILQELSSINSERFTSRAVDMGAGEVDDRPLTEAAILTDMIGRGIGC